MKEYILALALIVTGYLVGSAVGSAGITRVKKLSGQTS